jgi:16S rRNA (cytosine967-C5)-methyltransferase
VSQPSITPRSLALATLRRVEERGAYADATLGAQLERAELSPADRALATRLVYGTLAWRGRLDWHLAQVCTTPPESLDPWLRVILRLGLFQILFLDRIPAHAAVDTSVDLARGFKHGAATGLVNAALRRAAVDPGALTLPDPAADPVEARAIRWSHPRWLVEHWARELPEADLEALLQADQTPAPTVLRVNTLRTGRGELLHTLNASETIRARATSYSPVGILLEGGITSAALPPESSTAQSEASQLVAYLLGATACDRVLDVCAAPGGKTTHLAELMRNQGEIVAVDVSDRGLTQVERRAAALGISIIRTRRMDARRLAAGGTGADTFDRVLIDAPCTGLGTLRGHPELRWRVQPADLRARSLLQSEILNSVAHLCRPGGVLVYATCTIDRLENEDVAERFRATHPDFFAEDPRTTLPDSMRGLVDSRGILRTFPHRHGLDGFFAVRLRRRNTETT